MNDIDRRSLLAMAALAGGVAALPAFAEEETGAQHEARMEAILPDAPKVAMLIHPRMVALDLIGPMTILKILRCDIHTVWKDRVPVTTDVAIPIAATRTFEDCPRDLDVLFVPGGILGTVACMNDAAVITFLADRGARASWVTSVCTGGLLLAAAGLLKDHDATAYWPVADLLPLMGARRVDRRLVVDRNRITGAGVTAGLDFGLELAGRLRGPEAAKRVQLTMEYAPAPPFDAGTPAGAGPELTAATRVRRRWMDGQARLAAEAAGRRLGTFG